MIVLVDTNLLCRIANPLKPPLPEAMAAKRALGTLRAQSHSLAITPQCIFEFWAVATRQAGLPPSGSNGLGMTPDRAYRLSDFFLRHFQLLRDTDQHLQRWRTLVKSHGITGFKCHDVRLIASMDTHGISNILTFNAQDFRRFPHINIIDPNTF